MAAVWFVPPQPVQAQEQICFTEVDDCIDPVFSGYWQSHGGLPVFGLPIAPIWRGEPVRQEFERNWFESHPENTAPYHVLLSRLGAQLLEKQGRDWKTFPKTGPIAGCKYFGETEQSVCGDILAMWQSNGLEFDGQYGKSEAESLALFGLPLSGEIAQKTSAGTFTVQWFERARFEKHPENAAPYNVLLGLLGSEAKAAGILPETGAPPPPAGAEYSIGLPYNIGVGMNGPGGRYNLVNFYPNIILYAPNGDVVADREYSTTTTSITYRYQLPGGSLTASSSRDSGGQGNTDFNVTTTNYSLEALNCDHIFPAKLREDILHCPEYTP